MAPVVGGGGALDVGGEASASIGRIRLDALNASVGAFDTRGAIPSVGSLMVTGLNLPGGPGIRIDSAVYEQATVQPYYDSLVAKIIAWAPTRDQAIERMLRALDEVVVEGIHTTVPLQKELLASEAFRSATMSTRTIEEILKARDERGKLT